VHLDSSPPPTHHASQIKVPTSYSLFLGGVGGDGGNKVVEHTIFICPFKKNTFVMCTFGGGGEFL